MKTASLATEKSKLAPLLETCTTEGPVIIQRDGKPIAVLVAAPADEDELERLILRHCPRFWEMLERSEKDIQEGKVLSSDEFWKAVEQRAKAPDKKIVKGGRKK